MKFSPANITYTCPNLAENKEVTGSLCISGKKAVRPYWRALIIEHVTFHAVHIQFTGTKTVLS